MRKRIAAALLALLTLTAPAFAAFDDVSDGDWFAPAAAWAEAEGVMNGVSADSFDPYGAVTRAMAVTMLYRMAGSPAISGVDLGHTYADVEPGAWYADAVYWAQLEGVANGTGADAFSPNAGITREQMAAMLWRYAGQPEAGEAADFTDGGRISSWAADAVAWAAAAGIVSGRDGGAFDPQGGASRAECAAMLMRYDESARPEEPEYVPDLDAIPRNSYDAEKFYIDGRGRLQYEPGALTGIDVSLHQGEIDWAAVAADGIDFAIIRVGYRGYSEGEIFKDAFFEANIEGALENGLDVGVYFFSQALSVDEALEEAGQTIEWISGYDVSYPVVFDWERIEYDSGRTADVSGVTVTDCALAFCGALEAAGYSAMTYGSPSTVNEDIYMDRLTDYPFWLAHYTEDLAVTEYPYFYDMWQYSSNGDVDGIEGRVDMNLCFGSLAR